MVKNQILPNNVQGKELINAFMSIKKELFVPKKFHDLVYSDADIMINEKRALIRTFIMAKMFEKCKFSKNDSILVVGCLTGYSLAILSSLVSYVFGIDNEKNVVEEANNNINFLNILNCSVFYKKDLSNGLNRNAPYDKIFIEGAVKSIPQNIVKQLKDDGQIFTVIKNDEFIGEFVRGIKVKSGLSFENLFITNVNELEDFIIWDYVNEISYRNQFFSFKLLYQ